MNLAGSLAALSLFWLLPWDVESLVRAGVWPWAAATLGGAGQAVTLVSGTWMAANAAFGLTIFFSALYGTLSFDINARSFLDAVRAKSGGTGLGHFDAGSRAVASIAVANQLRAMRDMLASRAAARAAQPPSGSLSVHLAALADRGGAARGLGLASLALAPSEAATLARTFAKYDSDGDDKLNVQELRQMMKELTPGADVSEEAADAALAILDCDGDGKVELDEFAAWYGASRLWHRGGEKQETAEPVASAARGDGGKKDE